VTAALRSDTMRALGTVSPALAALHRALRAAGPLPALDPVTYAEAHAAFEACSDQRGLLTSWLRRRLGSLAATAQPVSVLSVGCGDGAVDAPLADLLTRDPERRVRYAGIDPFPGSTTAWAARMAGLGRPGLAAAAVTATFDGAVEEPAAYDVVMFVHSLYYVPDVGAALARAARQLAPGGELLVLHAPRTGLNELTALLAPVVSGAPPQWWAETTALAVAASGLRAEPGTLSGRLNLGRCLDPDDAVGRAVLDFTVQARLTDALRPLVLDRLRELALPGPGLLVEHPLSTWVMRQP